ncbi:hypothetical protein ACU4GI_33580 [Cupriavidus basilensis]
MTDTNGGGLVDENVKLLLVLKGCRVIDHPLRQSANFRSRQAVRTGLEIAVEGNIEAAGQGGLRQDRCCCSDRADVFRQ